MSSSQFPSISFDNKDQANGYAGLDSGGKLKTTELPSVVEQNTNKDAASGYAGLDSNSMLKLAEQATAVNAQTGTSYTVADGDRAKTVTFSNASAVAVTLPQAGASSQFKAGWFARVLNVNVGPVTITPTTSTINGALTSITLQKHQSAVIVSDGANYAVMGILTPVNPTDGQVLTYVAADSQWEPKSLSALGGANASQLRSVSISTGSASPKPRQVLAYNEANGDWESTYVGPGPRANWHGFTVDPTTMTAVLGYGGGWTVQNFNITGVNATATEPFYVKISSPSTGNNAFYGWSYATPQITTGIFRYAVTRCILGSTGTHAGYYLGLSSAVGPQLIAQSASLAANFVGFRFWNGTDTHWQAYVGKDATHITLVDTGITPDTNSHIYEIFSDGTNFHFYIDGTKVATISVTDTNAPANTTLLGQICWLSNQNGATVIPLSCAYAFWESSV